MPLRALLTTALLISSLAAQAATQVLPLNYRTSDEVLGIAQSFLGRDGSVTAYGNKLVVNAEPSKIDELSALLDQLDRPAKRLLISVDTSDRNTTDQTRFPANGPPSRVVQYGTANRTGGVQQIQASEGTPALIQTGQSIPLTSIQTDGYGGVSSNTEYRNVTRGFYVTASVTGDIVHLSISTNNDRVSQERADVVNIQSTDTKVSGRLGEWITLAGISEQSQLDRRANTLNYSTEGRDSLTVRVKVDSLD